MRVPSPSWPRLLLVLALTALVAAPAKVAEAAPPGPPRDEFFGANVQSLLTKGFPTASWDRYLGAMRGMGLRVARADAPWSWVEPGAPVEGVHSYDWRRLDKVVRALARAGVRWAPVNTYYLPSWTKRAGERFHPDFYDDYAAYMAALARRYGHGGQFWAANPALAYLPVHQYEVWNEPNSTHFWRSPQDPKEYMRLYEPVRTALAAADPNAQALFSLGWPDFDGYVKGALEDPGAGVDGIGFHPYGLTADATLQLVRRLRLTLRSLGRGDVPIYLTEWGLPSSRLGDGRLWADETRAATYALVSDGAARSDCGVGNLVIYTLVEPETDPTYYEESMGILDRTGALTGSGTAYRDAAARFSAEAEPASLPLCGEGTPSPGGPRLPLELSLEALSRRCYRGIVRYRGNPLEDATLHFRSRGAAGALQTDRAGAAEFCLPQEDAARGGTARAEVSRVAASPTLRTSLRDRVAPVITRFSLNRRRLRIEPRRPAAARAAKRRRSFFRYALSEHARVRIRIRRAGRRARGACPRSASRACKRARLAGTITRTARAGGNRTRFAGWIGRRPLAPGRYRAVIVATDAAGNSSSRPTRFWIGWSRRVFEPR